MNKGGNGIKKALIIVSSMDRGGAETFLMKVYRELDTTSFQMDFAANKKGEYDEEIIQKNGKIFYIPLRSKHPIKCFLSIIKIVKSNRYEYVVKPCNTSIGYFDLLAAKMGGAKKIVVRSCNSNADMGVMKRIICKLLLPLFNHITDVKLAPSTEAGMFTFGEKAVSDNKVIVLKNGLNLDTFSFQEETRIRKRIELGIESENMILVACIGRFTRQKNHSFIIDVFNELKRAGYSSIQLILIGDGELRNTLEDKVNNLGLERQIRFLGLRKDVPELLSAMDALVLPSFYEGMPNVVIEAQASGLPCLVSDKVTKEAAVTDLVTFLQIDNGVIDWVTNLEMLKATPAVNRTEYGELLKNAGYDISDVKNKFVKYIFEDIC